MTPPAPSDGVEILRALTEDVRRFALASVSALCPPHSRVQVRGRLSVVLVLDPPMRVCCFAPESGEPLELGRQAIDGEFLHLLRSAFTRGLGVMKRDVAQTASQLVDAGLARFSFVVGIDRESPVFRGFISNASGRVQLFELRGVDDSMTMN